MKAFGLGGYVAGMEAHGGEDLAYFGYFSRLGLWGIEIAIAVINAVVIDVCERNFMRRALTSVEHKFIGIGDNAVAAVSRGNLG